MGLLPESTFTKTNSNNLVFIPWEAKFIKNLSAFSFKRIETHQDYYLSEYGKALNVFPLLIVGANVSRGDNRIYIFDYNDCGHILYKNEFSIHKKYLEKLPYNEVHKGLFTFSNIITKNDFIKAYDDPNFWDKIS